MSKSVESEGSDLVEDHWTRQHWALRQINDRPLATCWRTIKVGRSRVLCEQLPGKNLSPGVNPWCIVRSHAFNLVPSEKWHWPCRNCIYEVNMVQYVVFKSRQEWNLNSKLKKRSRIWWWELELHAAGGWPDVARCHAKHWSLVGRIGKTCIHFRTNIFVSISLRFFK